MSKLTMFRSCWLNDPQFAAWLSKSTDLNGAKCTICDKTINLSNMGRRALISHMNGAKHQKNFSNNNSTVSLKNFIKKNDISQDVQPHIDPLPTPSQDPVTVASETNSAITALKSQSHGLRKVLLNDSITKAEILWCLSTVMTHSSLRAASCHGELFKTMFPDSEIATKMQLHRDKICYMMVYGIAPFFQNQLVKIVGNSDYFVVGFDEALNKIAQKKQLDMNLRFWDYEVDEVRTRYLTSIFLGKSTAIDLLDAFKKGLCDHSLKIHKILQISMDGPNVNYKFLRDLHEFLKEEAPQASTCRTPLHLGSCGLHTLHGAFKTGITETGWSIIPFLRSVYNLFKDSPARRADFTNITKSTVFAKKFCSVRWLQNVEVADRAFEMIPNLKLFVKNMKETINTTSFKVVRKGIEDPFLPAKLQFFRSLASDLEPFLREFQKDYPMSPFIYGDLRGLLATQMDRVVNKDVMKECTSLTSVQLVEKNLLPAKDVNIGIGTKNELKKAVPGRLKDSDILNFREDCKKAVVKFLIKMLEKSPLKFKLTRAISCFDPKVALEEEIAKMRMGTLLEILLDSNWLTSNNVDKVEREYISLINDGQVKSILKDYSRKLRLDHFWNSLIKEEQRPNLRSVMKIILTLSHGNANVERGFSINSECVVENMRDELLIARRCIYDAVLSVGGVEKLAVEKSLMQYARNAHSKFFEAKRRKKKADEEDATTKEQMKRRAQRKLEQLEMKKRKIMEQAEREAALLNAEIKDISGEMERM